MPAEVEPVDPKTKIDEKCGQGCTAVWATYKQCEARIEDKVVATPALPLARALALARAPALHAIT